MYRYPAMSALIAVVLSPHVSLMAQVESPQTDASPTSVVVNPTPPKTRLESAVVQKGSLIIAGYTDIGTVQGENGVTVRVTTAEITNAITTARQYGLIVTIHQGDAGGREARSYVDEDEIDSLIASLDAMGKLDRTVTQMNNFDARYRTRGDLEIANIDNAGVREVTVHGVEILSASGEEFWATARYPLARISELSQYLVSGKQAIDRAKASK